MTQQEKNERIEYLKSINDKDYLEMERLKENLKKMDIDLKVLRKQEKETKKKLSFWKPKFTTRLSNGKIRIFDQLE